MTESAGEIPHPAVGAHRLHELEQLAIICRHHAAFHGRDVVREERAESRKMAERPGFLAAELGVHGFAVVFDEIQAALVGEPPHDIQSRRIAENADAQDGAGPRSDGRFELAAIHIDGLKLDIHDLELETVLLQRMVGGGPGNCRHDHLIAALQRAIFLIEERGHGEQVGGRSGIHHHRVLALVIGGKSFLESRYICADGEAARGDDALDRVNFFRAPGTRCQLVKHWF